MKSVTIRFVLLLAIWLLWSGHTEPLILGFGVASCTLVVWLTSRLYGREEAFTYRLGARPILYVPWLLWEIVKANIDVAKVVLSPKMVINPRMIRVRASQVTEPGQAIYANSITLTPGTITLDLRDGTALVHALTDEAADGLAEGEMDRRVAALEVKS